LTFLQTIIVLKSLYFFIYEKEISKLFNAVFIFHASIGAVQGVQRMGGTRVRLGSVLFILVIHISSLGETSGASVRLGSVLFILVIHLSSLGETGGARVRLGSVFSIANGRLSSLGETGGRRVRLGSVLFILVIHLSSLLYVRQAGRGSDLGPFS
jgi:hypothetical protein